MGELAPSMRGRLETAGMCQACRRERKGLFMATQCGKETLSQPQRPRVHDRRPRHGPGGQQSQQGGRALECGLSSRRLSLAPAQPQPSLGATPSPIRKDAPAGKPRVTGSHPPSMKKVRHGSQSCPCPVPALGLHPQNRLFRNREGELKAGGPQSVPEAEPDFASPPAGARHTKQPPDPPNQSPGSRPAWQPPSPRAGNRRSSQDLLP